jgi:CubicO group peptidase (beta-lactamase class C family)
MKRSSLWRASAAAAVVASLGMVPAAQAVPGIPSARFDPNSAGWKSYRDQSSGTFGTTYTQNRSAGFLVTDLDIEVMGSAYRVGSVWQQNTDNRNWRLLRDLTSAQFSDAWNEARDDGLRLVDQETYILNGTRRWAGVWIRNVEGYGWASYRGMTRSQLTTRAAEQRTAGRMPIDVDQYVTSDGVRYAAAWVRNAESLGVRFEYGIASSEFASKFNQYRATYRMLTVTSVRTSAGQRYSGIWVSNRNGRGWSQYRDMTAQGFNNRWNRAYDEGYRLVAFDRYETSGGTRYAGVWRQNTSRPSWGLRSEVNARVQRELTNTAVPGIGVAVFQNGQIRYMRGFGYADINDGVWMDSRHVGSLASVSKAVAGVLTLRMVERGEVALSDPTRSWVPTMPAHHVHTVGQLLSNRGCVGHYDDIPSGGFDDTFYPTALSAAQRFWTRPLVCTPPSYYYSTHGYTLLGAALEAAGGTNVKTLVRSRLSNPYNLGTLRPQNLADSSVRRMRWYTSGNQEVALQTNDWKVLGGGLDSSTYDLARFGDLLTRGGILTTPSRTTMWTPPDTSRQYAYGWDIGSQRDARNRSHRVAAKGGSWTGALTHLRIYPDDGITVAVMMNDRSQESGKPAQNPGALTADIGRLVLDTLP